MPQQNTEYSEKFKVYRHDGDCRGHLKPAALLRYAQQVAMQNAWNAGLTDEVYAKTHTAYVLAKLALHFDRLPHVDETLTLLTQPQKAFHAVNKRITRVFDEAGAQAALIDSRWVVIDPDEDEKAAARGLRGPRRPHGRVFHLRHERPHEQHPLSRRHF